MFFTCFFDKAPAKSIILFPLLWCCICISNFNYCKRRTYPLIQLKILFLLTSQLEVDWRSSEASILQMLTLRSLCCCLWLCDSAFWTRRLWAIIWYILGARSGRSKLHFSPYLRYYADRKQFSSVLKSKKKMFWLYNIVSIPLLGILEESFWPFRSSFWGLSAGLDSLLGPTVHYWYVLHFYSKP